MGDPRRRRKKYDTPGHPWHKTRIEQELVLKKEYGLKNKKELWKMTTTLKNFADQAKRLIAASGKQADLERAQLFARLERLGLLPKGSALDDILGLSVNDILNRRLQTVVFKRNFARSIKQSRQFITHQQIVVNGKTVTAPSYIVSIEEEPTIRFAERSALSKEDHPERAPPEPPAGTVVSPEEAPASKEKKFDKRKPIKRAGARKPPYKPHQKKQGSKAPSSPKKKPKPGEKQ